MTATPAEALGEYYDVVCAVVVDLVRARTNNMIEANAPANSRYGMAFGSQWRDLLADSVDAFNARGFPIEKLAPAGYEVPVVNGCLVYVCRKPNGRSKAAFASSATRRGGLDLVTDSQYRLEYEDQIEFDELRSTDLNEMVRRAPRSMPFVVVYVESSPNGLSSIVLAVLTLNPDGTTQFNHEEEILGVAEVTDAGATTTVVAFDSGAPVKPLIEPRPTEGPVNGG